MNLLFLAQHLLTQYGKLYMIIQDMKEVLV